MKNIVIIHYNTPELTYATIQSVRKQTPGCLFTILDNSDRKPFNKQEEDINIIDNTKGQILDFEKILSKYKRKRWTCNNHASSKHILSVDYIFKLFNEGFVLLDSDVLIKKDISQFFDNKYIWCGEIEQQEPKRKFKKRLKPFLLWINLPICKENNIDFVIKGQNYKLSHTGMPYYDTGASFYASCCKKGLKGKEININDYIEHFGGGSYKENKDYKLWLEEHKNLYI